MYDEDCARQVDEFVDVAGYEYTVSRPGKFEGETRYVPYFWDIYLEGGANEDDGDILKFEVLDEDILNFPELKEVKVIGLIERDDGFVKEV